MSQKTEILVEIFSANLRLVRDRLGLSQEDAATRAGISRQQWSNLERGIHPPGLDTVEKVARGLGVEVIDLLQ